jgi:hypothetical protein
MKTLSTILERVVSVRKPGEDFLQTLNKGVLPFGEVVVDRRGCPPPFGGGGRGWWLQEVLKNSLLPLGEGLGMRDEVP